jgi:hypothetical protein
MQSTEYQGYTIHAQSPFWRSFLLTVILIIGAIFFIVVMQAMSGVDDLGKPSIRFLSDYQNAPKSSSNQALRPPSTPKVTTSVEQLLGKGANENGDVPEGTIAMEMILDGRGRILGLQSPDNTVRFLGPASMDRQMADWIVKDQRQAFFAKIKESGSEHQRDKIPVANEQYNAVHYQLATPSGHERELAGNASKQPVEAGSGFATGTLQIGFGLCGVMNLDTKIALGTDPRKQLVVYTGDFRVTGELVTGRKPRQLDVPGVRVSEQTINQEAETLREDLYDAIEIGRFEMQVASYQANVMGIERKSLMSSEAAQWTKPDKALRVTVVSANEQKCFFIYCDKIDIVGDGGPAALGV